MVLAETSSFVAGVIYCQEYNMRIGDVNEGTHLMPC